MVVTNEDGGGKWTQGINTHLEAVGEYMGILMLVQVVIATKTPL